MGKPAAIMSNQGSDHAGFPPTPITAGSGDVFIDGMPCARVGDPLAPHSKPNHPPHGRAIAAGAASVLVNNKPIAIHGSAITCGGTVIAGTSVTVGG